MFGNLMSALQDPEFMEKLQSMPQEIVDKLNAIDAKLDILVSGYQRFYDFVANADPAIVDAWHFTENAKAAEQQNSNAANLQISDAAKSAMEHPNSGVYPSINPVDPDSYK